MPYIVRPQCKPGVEYLNEEDAVCLEFFSKCSGVQASNETPHNVIVPYGILAASIRLQFILSRGKIRSSDRFCSRMKIFLPDLGKDFLKKTFSFQFP